MSAQMMGMAKSRATMPEEKPFCGLLPGPALEFSGMRMNFVEDRATVDTQAAISPRPKTTCPATKCSAVVPEEM